MTDEHTRRDPITYRDQAAIRSLLEFLVECQDEDADKATFTEVLETLASEGHNPDTLENMVYELQAFGAIRRTGRYLPGKGKDSRRLSITTLGRHWLNGTTPEPLGAKT